MSEYITYRADAIREEGLDPQELLGKVADTGQANSVLRRFTDLLSE